MSINDRLAALSPKVIALQQANADLAKQVQDLQAQLAAAADNTVNATGEAAVEAMEQAVGITPPPAPPPAGQQQA